MGFLFVDSFDHYAQTNILSKYDAWSQSANISISSGTGRGGSNCLQINHAYSNVVKSFTPGQSIYIGFALWRETNASYRNILGLYAPEGTGHVSLGLTASNFLEICYGGDAYAGTQLGISAQSFPANEWHYVEFYAYIADSPNGLATLKVDGVGWLTLTGKDTKGTNTYVGSVSLFKNQGGGNTNAFRMDDLYIHDSAFQGDVRVLYQAPTGAGNYTQFDPSAGNNWDCVEENPPSTSEYVSTIVADEIDSYVMANISPSTGTVKAVVGNYYVQKTDAGSRQLDMLTRLSSTDLLTGSPKGIPSSWGFLQFIQETKPGGGAWSVQDTKDAEMGMKLEV